MSGAGVEILACVKRVPQVGGTIVLTADGQDVDTRRSGFTVSPHEECAVEAAVQLTEQAGGRVTVLTLGPPEADAQLRDMLALGAHRAVLLRTDGREWGPSATASAIAAFVSGGEVRYDLLLLGHEAADTGDAQVSVRVAYHLGLPCVTGIKALTLALGGDGFQASREYQGRQERYDLRRPAVISVREGINLPRYPSLPGRLRARRAPVEVIEPRWTPDGLHKRGLRVPPAGRQRAEVLGQGTDAVPALVDLLDQLGLLP
jgi:electron transfer flavoprotein beta subunit